VFELTVKSCPTFDNIFIEIEVGAVFRCRDDNKSIEEFVYNISINQLNKQIKAAITERIRVLGMKFLLIPISSWKDLSRGKPDKG
jgi:hypothetical protein